MSHFPPILPLPPSLALFLFHSYRVLSVSADSRTAAAGVNETVSDDVYLYR